MLEESLDACVFLMRHSTWYAKYPNLKPEDVGLRTGRVLGVLAVISSMSEKGGPEEIQEFLEGHRVKDEADRPAIRWFYENAEWYTPGYI